MPVRGLIFSGRASRPKWTFTGSPFIGAASARARYTYRLSDLTDLPGLWAGLSENIRREYS